MIKANELRIGNKILSIFDKIETVMVIAGHEGYKERKEIHEIHKHYINVEENKNTYNLAEIKPIPITEECLLEFGFKKSSKTVDFELLYKGWTIEFDIFNEIVDCYLENIGIDILFVHQLQNLYFVLTGKELKIVLKKQPSVGKNFCKFIYRKILLLTLSICFRLRLKAAKYQL